MDVERIASAIGGGAVALYGLTRGSLPGAAMAALGSAPLLYRAVTGQRPTLKALTGNATQAERAIQVERALTIDKPAAELYAFYRDFARLPQFMTHLESVTTSGEGARRSHWVAKAPLGQTVQWDADITEERENEFIAWRSLPGADVDNRGSVTFEPAPGGRGTVVRVSFDYNPPAGAAVARLFGEEPNQQVLDDLRRFKQLMEAGEIPTTDGQPAGERAPHGLSLNSLKEKLPLEKLG